MRLRKQRKQSAGEQQQQQKKNAKNNADVLLKLNDCAMLKLLLKLNDCAMLKQQLKLSDGAMLKRLRQQRNQSAGEQQQKKNRDVLPKRRYTFCSQ